MDRHAHYPRRGFRNHIFLLQRTHTSCAKCATPPKRMAEGDYTVRVHVDSNSRDEVGQLALTFNGMAEELQHADQMRRDMVANVSHELRTPVSAPSHGQGHGGWRDRPYAIKSESILNQTHRLSDLIAFLLIFPVWKPARQACN